MGDDRSPTSSDQLRDFKERLNRAQASIRERDREAYGSSSAYSFGLRIATELVVAIAVGFGAGWGLDHWLGTKPWFLVLFIVLGAVAGILNVVRAAHSAEARRHLGIAESTSGDEPGSDRMERSRKARGRQGQEDGGNGERTG